MKKTIVKKSLAWLLTLMMVITFMPSVVFAAPGDAPKNDKTVVLNEDDGTYEIELSITGEALVEEEQTAGSVNVLLVYDVSQSMSNRTNGTSGFNASGPRRADEAEDIVHDFLVKLTDYQNSAGDNIHVSLVNFAVTATQVQGWTTDVDSLADRFGDGGNYNDAKFSYTSMGTNWDHALQLARALMESNTFPSGNPTFVIMVTDGAPTAQGSNATTGMNPENRDWWEFRDYYDAATDDASWIASQDDTTMFGIYAYGTESDLLDDLLYYAKNGEHRSYGNTNIMTAPQNASSHDYGETESAENYFNAESTEALQEAVSKIFEKVVQALGITEVAMSDGTTSQVDTSTGVANLLHVDESSYKYYLTIPLLNGKFKDNKNREITVSISGSTATFTWTEDEEEKEATYTVVSQPAGAIKVQWTEETAFYPGPPDAVFEDGAVNWDLKDLGTLLDGVTYSYAFACSPSQYTNDLIADLKNGNVEYGDPDYGDVWDYIKPNADGTDYSLKTNTETSISYKDTRMENPGPYETEFPEKDPVPTKSDEINIEKNWVGEYNDEQLKETITMYLLRDGEKIDEIVLEWNEDTEKPKHLGSKFIATGQMTVDSEGKINIFAPGHDYQLQEPQDLSYHWELVAEIMHPMIINGTPTMLVLVDEEDVPEGMPEDAEYYKDSDEDETEYYRLTFTEGEDDPVTKVYKVDEQDSDEIKLTATNYRRSNLNLTKAVTGETADNDAEFTFDMKLTAPKNATGDDLVFWFSVKDADGNRVYEAGDQTTADKEIKDLDDDTDITQIDYDASAKSYTYVRKGNTYTVPAADDGTEHKYYTGYYSFDSGSTVTVTLQEGWNLRFTNVLTGTIYEFTETNAGENNFAIDDIAVEWAPIPPEDSSADAGTPTDVTEDATVEDASITGDVVEGNAEYTVTFTNKYELGALKITKNVSGGATMPGTATFTVKGPSFNKQIPYSDFENGEYTVYDLPDGNYTVTESGADVRGYTLQTTYSNGGKATISADNRHGEVTVTNTYTKSSGPDIPDEPIPLDLNGEDHFAYIEGYPDGTVQPEGNITRAEVATMIYRLLTEERRAEIFTSECNYSDVDLQNWFNKAVASMTAGEYVNGYPNGTFLPNQKITRAEFVTIVVRFLEGERDAENPFTDIDGHWAQKYILSAVDAGWIDGYPDGTFRPQEPIKRDEAMKIMNTILHRGINEESELGDPVMFPDNADSSAWYYYEVIEATNNHETEGERPDEDWDSNECEYEYDIQKYERPDSVEPAPQDDPEEQTTPDSQDEPAAPEDETTPDDQDEPAATDNSIVGQWEYTVEEAEATFVYTFNEDGTGNYDMAGTVKAFTYTIEGNTLSILYEGDTEPFELPFVVTDTTLTVKDSNDEDVVYNKK